MWYCITPECDDGIEGYRHGVACCAVSCGQCGGAGCENLEGGASGCCSHNIVDSDEFCSDTGVAPCLLDMGALRYAAWVFSGFGGVGDGVVCDGACVFFRV